MGSFTDHADNLMHGEKKQTHVKQKTLATCYATGSSVVHITLNNRFPGLPVEKNIMHENSVENIVAFLVAF